MAERLGITSFTRPGDGLAFTLGGGDVNLLELTGLYLCLQMAAKNFTRSHVKIVEYKGESITNIASATGAGVRPEHAFLIPH